MDINRVAAAAEFIRSKTDIVPKLAIVLGSGLNDYIDRLENGIRIDYSAIPGFHKIDVPGHRGQAGIGYANGCPVIAFAGRYHYYEGHDVENVVLPVRLAAQLGAGYLLVTNAAGGINTAYAKGALVCITDHINFSGINPLRGENAPSLGVRFPDMTRAYAPKMQEAILMGAEKAGVKMEKGVYFYAVGPSYETPAEIRAMRALGADLVGMSTVMEVIAAAHAGLQVGGISCVTNMAAGVTDAALSGEEVIETAARVQGDFIKCLDQIAAIIHKF